MVAIKTNNGGVKLHVGQRSGAYRTTNQQVVRSIGRGPAHYKEHTNVPHEKLMGSPPYIAGVSPTPPTTNNPWTYYGQVTLVPANAETTIVSYVVAANQTIFLQGFQACGDADAMYTLYVNNQVVCKARTTPANLNGYVNLLSGTPMVQPGVSIKLTVICTTGQVDFYGTLLGYYNTF